MTGDVETAAAVAPFGLRIVNSSLGVVVAAFGVCTNT